MLFVFNNNKNKTPINAVEDAFFQPCVVTIYFFLASFEQKVREVGRVDGLCTIVTNRKYKTLLKLKRYYV